MDLIIKKTSTKFLNDNKKNSKAEKRKAFTSTFKHGSQLHNYYI
jgi:hypothetical protein